MTDLPAIYSGPGIFKGWKEVPIVASNNPMVALGAFSSYSHTRILSESMYAGETLASPYGRDELMGSLLTPFVRQSVAESLIKASEMLPDNTFMVVTDAYRPVTVQKALFDDLYNQYVAQGASHEEADEKAQEFLSKPSTNPVNPAPHSTGGSVDLTLVTLNDEDAEQAHFLADLIQEYRNDPDKQNIVFAAEISRMALFRSRQSELDMGCVVDALCDQSPSAYYEHLENPDEQDTTIRDNRRLLHHVMSEAGFTNYHGEWWHFDQGNQLDALKKNTHAVHGIATLDNTCLEHEAQMQRNYQKFSDILSGKRLLLKSDLADYVGDTDLLEKMIPTSQDQAPVVNKSVRIERIVL